MFQFIELMYKMFILPYMYILYIRTVFDCHNITHIYPNIFFNYTISTNQIGVKLLANYDWRNILINAQQYVKYGF